MKKCYKCLEWKELTDFYNCKSRSDGKQSACIQCRKDISTEFRSREDVKIKRRAIQNKWRAENREKSLQSGKNWRDKNPEKVKENDRRWRKNNSIKLADFYKKRSENKKRATPGWANLEKIEAKYFLAKRLSEVTGIKHSVDHFIPLLSPVVCGLHCENNLRVIALEDNIKKYNKIIEFDAAGYAVFN